MRARADDGFFQSARARRRSGLIVSLSLSCYRQHSKKNKQHVSPLRRLCAPRAVRVRRRRGGRQGQGAKGRVEEEFVEVSPSLLVVAGARPQQRVVEDKHGCEWLLMIRMAELDGQRTDRRICSATFAGQKKRDAREASASAAAAAVPSSRSFGWPSHKTPPPHQTQQPTTTPHRTSPSSSSRPPSSPPSARKKPRPATTSACTTRDGWWTAPSSTRRSSATSPSSSSLVPGWLSPGGTRD